LRLHSRRRLLWSVCTGVTSSLIGRIQQHSDGALGGLARRCGIRRRVYFETGETTNDAIARERMIKKWPGDRRINLAERDNPAWSDLAMGLGGVDKRQP